jgi:aconitate hydratase
MTIMHDSFDSRARFRVDGETFQLYRLDALARGGVDPARLPFSLKIVVENLLRHEDGEMVTAEGILALARRPARGADRPEITFRPGRVLLQDSTAVPVLADLAALRDAVARSGGDPRLVNPVRPTDLVIDHSLQVDAAGTADAHGINVAWEYRRNRERYAFFRWAQASLANFALTPPGMGIVHQVNLESLARVVATADDPAGRSGPPLAFPETWVGTDSHTTMINGLGVLGWGVGGIEAEAAMLGLPVSLVLPEVVGVRMRGTLPDGTTATDLVLHVTQLLRRRGAVGAFVEFFGEGLDGLPVADRATIANMAPEYGATCAVFPIDSETLRYLELTGRPRELVRLVEAYAKEQGLFRDRSGPEADYSEVLELDLATIEPSLAGPSRPQDRIPLREAKARFAGHLEELRAARALPAPGPASDPPSSGDGPGDGGAEVVLRHGSVVLAAITSCTNTSNPAAMIAAGLLARAAVGRGLKTRPWVKASLAPGSRVVADYLDAAGLTESLERLRFHVVGFGCTTCNGNSGPLAPAVSRAIRAADLAAVAVLSGNRNFDGRIHPEVRASYLASPPLVVAYALAGTMDIDLSREPLGHDPGGRPVFLRDLWPSRREIEGVLLGAVRSETFRKRYGAGAAVDPRWEAIPAPDGPLFDWDETSTYLKPPPFLEGHEGQAGAIVAIRGARALAVLGDDITTDHISPGGSFDADSEAGAYLRDLGVRPEEFNSYAARRGNHDVMARGTFANIRLRNRLAPGSEGGVTRHLPDGALMTVFEASRRYRAEGVPLIILAGQRYGSGSSRDWAAKGPKLLGVRAVLAGSFERIHRSNLVGMGILPLQFRDGDDIAGLGLTGEELYSIEGLDEAIAGGPDVTVVAERSDGSARRFPARVRIDSPQELGSFAHGGILPDLLRQFTAGAVGEGAGGEPRLRRGLGCKGPSADIR